MPRTVVWTGYPEQCPPENAMREERSVYRFIGKKAPRDKDFLSKKQQGRLGPDEDQCLGCGLSSYNDKDYALGRREFVTAFRKMRLARFDLKPEAGALLDSESENSGHVTWWPDPRINPRDFFGGVEE